MSALKDLIGLCFAKKVDYPSDLVPQAATEYAALLADNAAKDKELLRLRTAASNIKGGVKHKFIPLTRREMMKIAADAMDVVDDSLRSAEATHG